MHDGIPDPGIPPGSNNGIPQDPMGSVRSTVSVFTLALNGRYFLHILTHIPVSMDIRYPYTISMNICRFKQQGLFLSGLSSKNREYYGCLFVCVIIELLLLDILYS
jgi:hypothetical protein